MFHFMDKMMKEVKPFENDMTGGKQNKENMTTNFLNEGEDIGNEPVNLTKPNLNSTSLSSEPLGGDHERVNHGKKRVSWAQDNEEATPHDEKEKALKKRVFCIMLTLYALAFLASFAYWVQSGVLPYLTRRVGMTAELFGLMESSYALYQMITSPIYGRLGDIFGIRILYMLSEICSSITFGSLAFANSVPALFLTRVPALFMHSVQCSYMILTDISTKKRRADLIGKLGVLHGLGMICGSVTGGLITHAFDEQTAAIVAAISNLLSVLIVIIFIPQNTKDIRRLVTELQECDASPRHEVKPTVNKCDETFEKTEIRNTPTKNTTSPQKRKRALSRGSDQNSKNIESENAQCSSAMSPEHNKKFHQESEVASTETDIQSTTKVTTDDHEQQMNQVTMNQNNRNEHNNENESESIPTFKAMIAVLQFKNVKFLLLIKIIIAFPFSLLYSMFSMAIMDYYHLGPRVNGLILGYIGILTIVVQGVIVGLFTKRFTDAFIVKTMIFVNTIGFLFLIVSTEILILVVVVIPLAIGGSVSHIVLLAVMTKIVPPEYSGTALGFIFALHAIVRAVTPTLGGLTFATIGWPFFGVIGYLFHFVLLIYVTMFGRDEQYDS